MPRTFNYNHACKFPKPTTNVTVSHQFSPFDFPGHTTAVIAASSTDDSGIPSQDLAVLLEVDGVLVDAYRGNRIAFNKAFEKLGLDCASWSEPVYSDLLRCFFGYLLLYYFLACAYVLMEKVMMIHLDFMSSCNQCIEFQ
ncbi:hypothetical protein RYX36_030839 [Vicia faba]